MAVQVEIDLGYEFAVKAKADAVFKLLADVPRSVSHFPQVEQLVDLGKNSYRWHMARVGTAQVGIQTVYACKYKADAKKGTVVWTPVKGVGNAQISGSWHITQAKGKTDIVLNTSGVVEADLPALMQRVVAPVVQVEFERLVELYIDNLIRSFGGEVE